MSKKFLSVLAVTCFCVSTAANAAATAQQGTAQQRQGQQMYNQQRQNPNMGNQQAGQQQFPVLSQQEASKRRLALEECKASTPRAADGRFDNMGIRKCMENKGVIKPMGQANLSPQAKQALTACRSEAGTDAQGRPNAQAMRDCMKKRGQGLANRPGQKPVMQGQVNQQNRQNNR